MPSGAKQPNIPASSYVRCGPSGPATPVCSGDLQSPVTPNDVGGACIKMASCWETLGTRHDMCKHLPKLVRRNSSHNIRRTKHHDMRPGDVQWSRPRWLDASFASPPLPWRLWDWKTSRPCIIATEGKLKVAANTISNPPVPKSHEPERCMSVPLLRLIEARLRHEQYSDARALEDSPCCPCPSTHASALPAAYTAESMVHPTNADMHRTHNAKSFANDPWLARRTAARSGISCGRSFG